MANLRVQWYAFGAVRVKGRRLVILLSASSFFSSIRFVIVFQLAGSSYPPTIPVALQADLATMVWTKVANAIPLTPKSNFLELLETELSTDGLRHQITKRISFEIPAYMISLLLQRPRQFKNPSMVGTNTTQTRECQGRHKDTSQRESKANHYTQSSHHIYYRQNERKQYSIMTHNHRIPKPSWSHPQSSTSQMTRPPQNIRPLEVRAMRLKFMAQRPWTQVWSRAARPWRLPLHRHPR